MKDFIYYAPTKVYFGKGRENEIGKICKAYGYERVLIIYGGKSAEESGLIARVEAALTAEGIAHEKAGGVVPNPVLSRAREIAEQAKKFRPDFLLAVGGGSTIDTAKSVSYVLADPESDILDFYQGKPVTKAFPHGCIPTIAAAGSEMSDSAVLTDDLSENSVKYGTNCEANRCRFAVMNPELTFTLPKFQIGTGAADIFMHTADRYFVTDALTGNHLTDELAEALMRNIIKYGPLGYHDPTNYEAMSEIMWSSTVSHNDLTGLGTNPNGGRGGDWAVHTLGKALSALYNATHGASLTAVWGSWARYCYQGNPQRFVRFGKNVWGLTGTDEEIIANAIEITEKWFAALGQPLTLTELLGFVPDDAAIEKTALYCSGNRKLTIGQLKRLSYDDMVAIYTMAR